MNDHPGRHGDRTEFGLSPSNYEGRFRKRRRPSLLYDRNRAELERDAPFKLEHPVRNGPARACVALAQPEVRSVWLKYHRDLDHTALIQREKDTNDVSAKRRNGTATALFNGVCSGE